MPSETRPCCKRAPKVAAMLMQSELARRLMPELHQASQLRAVTLLGRECNLWDLNPAERLIFWEMHHNSSRDLRPHANVYGLRLAGPGLALPRRLTSCLDLELSAISQTLGPDSFYQTLMSEHAGIIALGSLLERRRLRIPPRWIGSASWKHELKGRPLPCNFLRSFNWSRLGVNHLVYWGPKTGPVQDWAALQADTARRQVDRRDLMRETQDRFFDEVFEVPAGLGSQMRSQGGVAHPWSNYIVVSHSSMITLARFNVLQVPSCRFHSRRSAGLLPNSFPIC